MGMELYVRGARGGTLRYWLRSLADLGAVPEDDRDAPAVIARSASGREHILQRTGTVRQARRAKTRFQNELNAVGELQFCRQYRLPGTNA